MLRDARFAETAVIVNERGTVAIDHALVRESSETVGTLPSGCIWCRVAGDLVARLRELHFQRAAGTIAHFRRVVIETTGLADPAPLLATLIEMPVVAARYALSGVVATVDAEHGMATLDRHAEAVKQAAVADRLVITKCDRAPAPAIAGLEERLRALNPGAVLLRATHGETDLPRLLDAGLYRAGSGWNPGWLNAGAYRRVGPAAQGSGHDARIRSFVWSTDKVVPAEEFGSALETLVEVHGARILRMKGLVRVPESEGPMAVHGVQHTLYPPAWPERWPDDDRRTRLVFIGRDLEERSVAQILNSFLRPPSQDRTPHGLDR
jgi:G3E family GTPase